MEKKIERKNIQQYNAKQKWVDTSLLIYIYVNLIPGFKTRKLIQFDFISFVSMMKNFTSFFMLNYIMIITHIQIIF